MLIAHTHKTDTERTGTFRGARVGRGLLSTFPCRQRQSQNPEVEQRRQGNTTQSHEIKRIFSEGFVHVCQNDATWSPFTRWALHMRTLPCIRHRVRILRWGGTSFQNDAGTSEESYMHTTRYHDDSTVMFLTIHEQGRGCHDDSTVMFQTTIHESKEGDTTT